MLDVVSVSAEILGQRGEQFRIGRRVGLPQVVFGLDQPAAQEVSPDTVDQGLGEIRILRAGQPVGEHCPPVARVIERQRPVHPAGPAASARRGGCA